MCSVILYLGRNLSFQCDYTVNTLFLLYTGCVFIILFLPLLYVSVILSCVTWYDLVDYFWVWGPSKIFPYKLMVIASLFYAISNYGRFHRNILLSDSRRNLFRDRWIPAEVVLSMLDTLSPLLSFKVIFFHNTEKFPLFYRWVNRLREKEQFLQESGFNLPPHSSNQVSG